jgi:hypothetical protein
MHVDLQQENCDELGCFCCDLCADVVKAAAGPHAHSTRATVCNGVASDEPCTAAIAPYSSNSPAQQQQQQWQQQQQQQGRMSTALELLSAMGLPLMSPVQQ